MATHSGTLAWEILWTEWPGGLMSMGSHRVSHEWSDFVCMHTLEKGIATHSSVLAWRISGAEEPGRLLSMGSHRVGHDWSVLAAAAVLVVQSCLTLWVHGLYPTRFLCSWNSLAIILPDLGIEPTSPAMAIHKGSCPQTETHCPHIYGKDLWETVEHRERIHSVWGSGELIEHSGPFVVLRILWPA